MVTAEPLKLTLLTAQTTQRTAKVLTERRLLTRGGTRKWPLRSQDDAVYRGGVISNNRTAQWRLARRWGARTWPLKAPLAKREARLHQQQYAEDTGAQITTHKQGERLHSRLYLSQHQIDSIQNHSAVHQIL